ncbi:MAG: hypothetical protein GXP19_01775 [Gammaproteobacteria bacterium]|nr:hypothetical protein [Gammaproteobacteria bacterium]
MVFYIRERPDGHATLMTEEGQVLWTFCSVDDAEHACREWYNINDESVECYSSVQEPLTSTIS